MPKHGQTQPFKVRFTYPGQKTYTDPHADLGTAEADAAMVGDQGETVELLYAPKGAEPVVLAKFGPDQHHHVTITLQGKLACACGRRTGDREEMNNHIWLTGYCQFCWGECQVYPVDTETGESVDCPVCGGSGDADDMSYHGVDTAAYLSKCQELIERNTPVEYPYLDR